MLDGGGAYNLPEAPCEWDIVASAALLLCYECAAVIEVCKGGRVYELGSSRLLLGAR